MPLERLLIRTVAEVFSYDEKIQSKIVELLTELEFANLAVLKIKLSSRNKDDIFLDAFNGFNQKLFSGRGVGRWHKNVIKVSEDSSNTFFQMIFYPSKEKTNDKYSFSGRYGGIDFNYKLSYPGFFHALSSLKESLGSLFIFKPFNWELSYQRKSFSLTSRKYDVKENNKKIMEIIHTVAPSQEPYSIYVFVNYLNPEEVFPGLLLGMACAELFDDEFAS